MNTYIFKTAIISSAIVLAACTQQSIDPQTAFMENLGALCGKSFSGRLVSTDESDKDFASKSMIMQVRECTADEIRIPFHVGGNSSRTWIISKTNTGLTLKHQHNHEDGHADAVTMYGGDTALAGTSKRQEFPVDEYSKAMFTANSLNVSVTNIWAIEITPKIYAYELRREGRHFRVEFDLNQEAPAPPTPW